MSVKPRKTSYSDELNRAFSLLMHLLNFISFKIFAGNKIYLDGNILLKTLKVLIKKQNQSLIHLKSIKLKDEGKVKGFYGMKFFYLADDENPFLHNLV